MKYLLALALTCVLSVSTLAGEIPSGGVTGGIPSDGVTGGIPSGGRTAAGEIPSDGKAASTQTEISGTTLTVLLTIIRLLPV